MLALTNEIKAEVDFNNLYADYNVLAKELDKISYKKRAAEIAEFRKSVPHLAYILTNKLELIYLQEKGNSIEPNSKRFEHLNRLETYRVVNLLLQLLRGKTSFFSLDEQDGGVYYIVEHKKRRAVKQVVTLSFKVDKRNCMQTNVVTFTSVDKEHKNGMLYKINGKTMQAASSEDMAALFVKRNRFGKNLISSFSANKRNYAKTKEYFRGILLEDIEKHLNRYLKLSFVKREVEY